MMNKAFPNKWRSRLTNLHEKSPFDASKEEGELKNLLDLIEQAAAILERQEKSCYQLTVAGHPSDDLTILIVILKHFLVNLTNSVFQSIDLKLIERFVRAISRMPYEKYNKYRLNILEPILTDAASRFKEGQEPSSTKEKIEEFWMAFKIDEFHSVLWDEARGFGGRGYALSGKIFRHMSRDERMDAFHSLSWISAFEFLKTNPVKKSTIRLHPKDENEFKKLIDIPALSKTASLETGLKAPGVKSIFEKLTQMSKEGTKSADKEALNSYERIGPYIQKLLEQKAIGVSQVQDVVSGCRAFLYSVTKKGLTSILRQLDEYRLKEIRLWFPQGEEVFEIIGSLLDNGAFRQDDSEVVSG